MTPNLDLGSLPVGLLVTIGILAVVQISLDVIAFVDLARRPRDRVTFELKWPWVLIVLGINLIGAILYFAIGRRPARAPSADLPTAGFGGNGAAGSVADSLYGEHGGRPE